MAQKAKKLKVITKQEHFDLWSKVDNEGFGYYMMYYGPDFELIEKLGFNKVEVEKAIELFKSIEDKIQEGESYYDEVEGEED